MKTTKINKGYYKGTYKGYNFIVTTSYDWRGVLQNWIGKIDVNGSEKIVCDDTKIYTLECVKSLIDKIN